LRLNGPTTKVTLVLLALSLAGCLCGHPSRNVYWVQSGVLTDPGQSVEYKLDDLSGGVVLLQDGRLFLTAISTHSVSSEDLSRFANALFQSQGWPPPTYDATQEYIGCADSF